MSKSERTRQFIIEKAAPIINRKGMAGTSISDIMAATKMAKGGVYGNFESKEEICSEALDHLLKKTGVELDAAVRGKSSFRDKLFAVLDYFKGTVGAEDRYGCPMLNFGAEADDTNATIKQQVSRAITLTEDLLARLVQGGVDSGEFDKGFDAGQFSIKAFAMIEGGMWISRVQNNNKQIRALVDLLKKEIEEHCQ